MDCVLLKTQRLAMCLYVLQYRWRSKPELYALRAQKTYGPNAAVTLKQHTNIQRECS